MPLPLKSLRVFPNPWAFIHHELGPQGAFPVDPAGRDVRVVTFVGAERVVVKPADRQDLKVGSFTVADPRGDGSKVRFRYPGLDAGLTKGTPVELPVTGYYLQALADGSLVPADDKTTKGAKFLYANLEAAKEAGVKKFEADYGVGAWSELERELAGKPADKAPSAPKKPATKAAEGSNG